MKDSENLHLKIQELCACFSGTDPLKEMSDLVQDKDTNDAALKWLALAALHGVNANAKKITLKETDKGEVTVVAEYRETELPSPGKSVGKDVFKAVRDITHIEGDKGKMPLALGIMDSSLDLSVGIKEKKGKRKITIKFPDQ
ncbi:MAG TPA: hypothetical protein DHV36_13240 [Desulfobacteraceae bacterium]|nr:hypothetical protein [Desulfobacteraceae bacterium]